MRSRRWFLSLLLAGSLATTALPAGSNLWIHVNVEEAGFDGESVRVNIPISMVKQILPLIDHEMLRDGKLQLAALDLDMDLSGVDPRELWKEIRKLDDAEFVTLRNRDGETVRVFKEGEFLLVRADEGRDRVEVTLPMEVIGALFSGASGELDLLAAVEALGRHGGDLVRVDDGDTAVRIWIDDRNVSE